MKHPRNIKTVLSDGKAQSKELADKYGVVRNTIYGIISGNSWKGLK